MRFTRLLRQATTTTTGWTGVAVHPSPRLYLVSLYKQTLSQLSQLPAHAVYRQSVTAITNNRLGLVERMEASEEIAKTLGVERIEQVISEAEDELKLIPKMVEWQAWEPLEAAEQEGQWDGPKIVATSR